MVRVVDATVCARLLRNPRVWKERAIKVQHGSYTNIPFAMMFYCTSRPTHYVICRRGREMLSRKCQRTTHATVRMRLIAHTQQFAHTVASDFIAVTGTVVVKHYAACNEVPIKIKQD